MLFGGHYFFALSLIYPILTILYKDYYDKETITNLALFLSIFSIAPDVDQILKNFPFFVNISHILGFTMLHRGLTHSFIFLPFFALLISCFSYSILKFFSRIPVNFILLFSLISFILFTHIFLDLIFGGVQVFPYTPSISLCAKSFCITTSKQDAIVGISSCILFLIERKIESIIR